jgi:guanylate kinase
VAGDDKRLSVRRGVLLVISSPSGAGKTTLSRQLLERETNIAMSVSVTTRPRRQSEIEGSHYFFKNVPEFTFMRESGQLLEWAEVHGNFYGTPREAVMKALAQGQDVLFDIDVQGTRQLASAMPDDVVSVFVLPPSIDEMRRRLKRRAEDDDATIIRRLRTAETELRHWEDYDYVIVNDDLDRSFSELRAILSAERLRRVRRPAIARLIEQLQHDLAAVVAAN